MTRALTARETDQLLAGAWISLGAWILITLAEHPMTYGHLVRWIRLQRPRLLPDAIEHAIQELVNAGAIECRADRWHVKGHELTETDNDRRPPGEKDNAENLQVAREMALEPARWA